MKKLLTLLLLTISLAAVADRKIVALLQPLPIGTTAIEPIEISMVRGELRTAISNNSDFQVVTRLDVDKILEEQGFQRTGMVDDNQRKEVGRMTGAEYICVSTITKYASQLYIEAYFVNVETGEMTNTATIYTRIDNADYSKLPGSCENLAKKILGEVGGGRTNYTNGTRSPSPTQVQDFTETAFDIDMKMIWVEGGDFLMGCTSEQSGSCESDEQNVRRVTVDGFYIGMLEVTQAQWEKVMGTSIYQQKAKASANNTYGVGPDYPMYYVSWEEAMEFCRQLSIKTGRTYTLPTEAQWEYAARGGNRPDGTKYAGSNMIDLVAWYTDNSGRSTHICGSKRANSLGIYDMSGNVWEWCKDWYGNSYISYDTNNPTGPSSGSNRVLRGGSWYKYAQNCRVANRNHNAPTYRSGDYGFRVVLLR